MMKQLISLQNDSEQSDTINTHRWMVSYADFISLLFVLFLVLYAKLPKQVAPPMPIVQPVHAPLIPGIRPRTVPQQPELKAPLPSLPELPVQTQEKQRLLLQELAATLGDLLAVGDITLLTRPDGVLLEIKDTALFASGTAQPAEQAGAILAKISAVFEKTANSIIVEGHTDSVPIQTVQFPSNWELSSARAASVVRALQERGISAGRLTASGLADTRPKGSNDTAQGRSENRRVSMLVLNAISNQQ
jgi:chemotaxis protein MotB